MRAQWVVVVGLGVRRGDSIEIRGISWLLAEVAGCDMGGLASSPRLRAHCSTQDPRSTVPKPHSRRNPCWPAVRIWNWREWLTVGG